MRERSSPRKPRPSSVATSMPSFVQVETPKSSRSKSTDRHARGKILLGKISKRDTYSWMKVFMIIPEFRILRLTFHRKSASKC